MSIYMFFIFSVLFNPLNTNLKVHISSDYPRYPKEEQTP